MSGTPAEPLGSSGRAAQLADSLDLLWPGSTVVTTRSREGEQYVLLPSRTRPTLMAPRRPRTAAAASLRNFKASGTRRTQVLLGTLALGARVGLLDVLPSRTSLNPPGGSDGSIRDHLRDVLADRGITVALQTSPPRANRKPVLQVVSAGGHTIAFVKVGINDLTSALVRAEGEALARVGRADLRYVVPPRLLHRGTWQGLEILVQSALPRSSGQKLESSLVSNAMVEVSGIDAGEVGPSGDPYLADLGIRVAALPESSASAALQAALRDLQEPDADATPPSVGSWHGDWTPWNMSIRDGLAQVWDWERFASGVPLGYDRLHFEVQGAIVRDGRSAGTSVRDMVDGAPTLLAPFEAPSELATRTALLYLVEIGSRYLHDRQEEAGSARGNLHTWLVPELQRGVHRLTGRAAR